MLKRIKELLNDRADFAFETTLSTKSYVSLVKKAQLLGYRVTLVYFWLESANIAFKRVANRVSKGGHNIPIDIIERRYYRGLKNLIKLYIPICDKSIIVDNNRNKAEVIAECTEQLVEVVVNNDIWETILVQANKDES